jgi:hypothetical protein
VIQWGTGAPSSDVFMPVLGGTFLGPVVAPSLSVGDPTPAAVVTTAGGQTIAGTTTVGTLAATNATVGGAAVVTTAGGQTIAGTTTVGTLAATNATVGGAAVVTTAGGQTIAWPVTFALGQVVEYANRIQLPATLTYNIGEMAIAEDLRGAGNYAWGHNDVLPAASVSTWGVRDATNALVYPSGTWKAVGLWRDTDGAFDPRYYSLIIRTA